MTLVNGVPLKRNGQPLRLYVDRDWLVANIQTLTEAKLAQGVLATAVAEIEKSLETAKNRPTANAEWYRKATLAKRWKLRALEEVERIIATLKQQTECGA